MPDSIGLDILRFLKAQTDSGKASFVKVIDLAEHFDLSFQEMRDHLTALETEGFVEGIHSHGGSGYLINEKGKGYIVKNV